jgi:nonsense-mediated mRNA decay protein 3
MCVNCIRTQVDISEGIQKQVTILWCKNCLRYLQPPKHWLRADLGGLPRLAWAAADAH